MSVVDHTIADAVITSMKTHKRKEADFYPTPVDATKVICDRISLDSGTIVWEPACGDGAMAEVISTYVGKDHVIATELRTDGGYGRGGIDFLASTEDDHLHIPEWIITNPPFNLAREFIEKALSITPNVAMLLKATYWSAASRHSLFIEHPPAWVLPLTWRPAFLEAERGKSPLMEVCWLVWEKNHIGPTKFEPLLRPKSDRVKTQFTGVNRLNDTIQHSYLELLGL